jgi:hypothetical protein
VFGVLVLLPWLAPVVVFVRVLGMRVVGVLSHVGWGSSGGGAWCGGAAAAVKRRWVGLWGV